VIYLPPGAPCPRLEVQRRAVGDHLNGGPLARPCTRGQGRERYYVRTGSRLLLLRPGCSRQFGRASALIYKNSKEADHAFYMRHRDRLRQKREISPNKAPPPEILSPAAEQEMLEREKLEGKRFWQAPNGEDHHVLTLDEAKAIHEYADAVGRIPIGTDMAVPDTGVRVLSTAGSSALPMTA
jgi:hypothetical protein